MAPPPQPITGSLSSPSHGSRSEGNKVASVLVVRCEAGGLYSLRFRRLGDRYLHRCEAGGLYSLRFRRLGDRYLHLSQLTFDDQELAIHGGNYNGVKHYLLGGVATTGHSLVYLFGDLCQGHFQALETLLDVSGLWYWMLHF